MTVYLKSCSYEASCIYSILKAEEAECDTFVFYSAVILVSVVGSVLIVVCLIAVVTLARKWCQNGGGLVGGSGTVGGRDREEVVLSYDGPGGRTM